MIFISVFLVFFASCINDQRTIRYKNYKEALQADFFANHWIPYELQDTSLTDIYVKTNTSSNSFIFAFKTENMPKLPLSKVEQTKALEIEGIDIPKWWNIGILNKPRTTLPTGHNSKINLILDYKNSRVYGWNK